jgi:uncharacterized membrane protein
MSAAARLDAFTDAAFAFAISLMVVGAGGGAPDYQGLVQVMRSVPSFAIGFAIMAMFWFAHVRWRLYRGEGDWRSVLLTFLLIFVVLVYVHPLRAMAQSFAAFLGGRGSQYGGHLTEMFTIYGIGFTTMALITCALYWDALRRPDLAPAPRREVAGQRIIWGILTVTGLVSIAISLIRPIAQLAPFAYATLPISIGLFASRWKWEQPA